MKRLKKLKDQLNRIESLVDRSDMINLKVSGASIGWHLHHSLLTVNKVYTAISNSDPDEYAPSLKFSKTLIMGTGIIPRKKAKAPKSVRPDPDSSIEEILNELNLANRNIERFSSLDRDSFFRHPYFGDLNLSQTIRFLGIHTAHHLKIVDDIINK